ncbi:aminoglycoside phosphotransferase family protein [Streptomyces sp. NPDC050534]|uniref:aminoglycoside phosphotransferase family protein n=1 Tax=Streptomyces sp. NPDC050534 TaxID=3365625 RepID=UPI0037A6F77B
MGTRPAPQAAARPHTHDVRSEDIYEAFVARAGRLGQASNGFHNQNYVLPLTDPMARLLNCDRGTSVTVRIRRSEALPVVIRTWEDESAILRAVRGALPNAPECLFQGDGFAIHSYVEGVPLSSVCGNGKPVDTLLMKALADQLAAMTQVRAEHLPALPPVWPSDHSDSQGFLQTLAMLADSQVRQSNWPAFGSLFGALGIPEDTLIRLAERVPALARRPYSLLHADLHRDNLIMSYGGDSPLICVDWELATYGDPLHDLATHLVRMQYPAHQWDEVVSSWADAMEEVRPAAVNGAIKDLRHYIAFERAQSVYPDVMRAAQTLVGPIDQKGLDAATQAVQRALVAAAEPLRLGKVPDEHEIEKILFWWRASRTGAELKLYTAGSDWHRDERVLERPDFPEQAVSDALLAEAAAPASRVFKGTAHVNTVVSVHGVGSCVVVRRVVPGVRRRERGFLSEHAVLGAIEKAGVAVAAPEILALGWSHDGARFAIHTYVGPGEVYQPPSHPVNGLLPREADRLVDQLCALTKVDYLQVDPLAGQGRFYGWLSEQLVSLVAELPKESQQLARVLGLPGADRLKRILARHSVSHREPALLHGDLNPWNLVRRDDSLALTIIDWEMALVGDPLYDLVRHMHLTPTRPEIRDRMFARWERLLPAQFTANWRQDWAVYRWIEIVRSAYVDLDRLVTGASLDAPNVQRAIDSYAMTLAAAIASLGLPLRPAANPYLARALA